MADFEVFYRLLISVKHHQTTANIILKNCIVNGLDFQTKPKD